MKKADYNTKIARIDTKVSSLDGKINEVKTKGEYIGKELIARIKDILSFCIGTIAFDEGENFQYYYYFFFFN